MYYIVRHLKKIVKKGITKGKGNSCEFLCPFLILSFDGLVKAVVFFPPGKISTFFLD